MAIDRHRTGTIRNAVHNDDVIDFSLAEILGTYGDVASIFNKRKALLKFGENEAVGTGEATLMTLGGANTAEVYETDNLIDYVVCSSLSGAGTVEVEGHTLSGGNLTFVIQTVTLLGQTPVLLPTPLARCSRIANTSAANWPAASLVYVYKSGGTVTAGVPQTANDIHCIGVAAENKSLKCSTSLSSSDYAIVTQFYASIDEKTAANAVIRFKVRKSGGVFQTIWKRGIHTTGSNLEFAVSPYIIVPPNADVIMTAEADGANTAIAAGFNAFLASNL
tara:strand:+ start:41 stop:871 length:831 start_codon:yes stop_codon:yes gene_type:complete